VALFADADQASGGAGRTFPGGEAQVAGEMPAGAKAVNVSAESDESGGGQESDTGNGPKDAVLPLVAEVDFDALGHDERAVLAEENRNVEPADLDRRRAIP